MAKYVVDVDTREAMRKLDKLEKEFKQFSNVADKETKQVGSSMKKLSKIKVFAGLAIGAAVIGGLAKVNALLKESVALANEQEKAEAGLEAVLKATGHAAQLSADDIKTMAAELQSVTTYGDEVILNAQAIIATFKNIKGDNFQRTTEAVLDMATVMGTDLKSAALQVSKAINDPIKGLDGLGRAGVQFTESQREMIKGMATTGDMMGAQAEILKELESQFGGTARAMRDTFGGAVEAVSNAYGDVLEEIGFFITKNNDVISVVNRMESVMVSLGATMKDNEILIHDFVSSLAEGFNEGLDVMIEFAKVLGNIARARAALELIKDGDLNWFEFALMDAEELKAYMDKHKENLKDTTYLTTKLADLEKERARWASQDKWVQEAGKEQIEWLDKQIAKHQELKDKAEEKITVKVDAELDDFFKDIDVAAAEEAGKSLGGSFGDGVSKEAKKAVEKLKDDVAKELGSIADEIRGIELEGMSEEGAWDSLVAEAKMYEEAAAAAAKAGDWGAAKENLKAMADIYKELDGRGVKGPEIDDKEIENAKKMVKYWGEILSKQTTYAGANTYTAKYQDALNDLKELQEAEAAGGKQLISAEEARKTKMDGLKKVSEGLLEVQRNITGEVDAQKDALGEIDDAQIDPAAMKEGQSAMEDMAGAAEEYGEALGDAKSTTQEIEGVWVNATNTIITSLSEVEFQVMAVDGVTQTALDNLRELTREAAAAAGSAAGSGAGGQSSGFAVGGVVPGFGGTDSISARLTPGEGVVTPLGMSVLTPTGLSQLNVGKNPFGDKSPDVVSMDFNFNKKSVGSLSGDRRTASKILGQFENMKRAIS